MAGLTLYDFYARSCHPCKLMDRVITEVAKERPGIKVEKVDVTKNQALAQQYGVTSVPTLALVNGRVLWYHRGSASKAEILQRIPITS